MALSVLELSGIIEEVFLYIEDVFICGSCRFAMKGKFVSFEEGDGSLNKASFVLFITILFHCLNGDNFLTGVGFVSIIQKQRVSIGDSEIAKILKPVRK